MAKIARVWAREILDSRGTPTIEAFCQLDTGHIAITSIPSGISTGATEALELRDNDPKRYKGKGVVKAIANINQIIGPAVSGFDPTDQTGIDRKLIEMDGTDNKTKLGANAILSVSQAVSKAGAMVNSLPLYKWIQKVATNLGINATLRIPPGIYVIIEGGLHGAGNLDFQEFSIVPLTSKPYSEGLRSVVEVYLTLGETLERRGAIHSLGQEGAYAPNLFTNSDALEVIVEAIKQTPYSIGRDIFMALDVAASTFYKEGGYSIRDKSAPMDEANFIEYYKELHSNYHLAILEDPLHEEAWEGWGKISEVLGNQVTIVGDDLLTTNLKRVEKAIENNACNAILVKPNQVGTVTETLEVVKRAKDAGWKIIISHRAGETNDAYIADFAVGVGADYVKFGAPARGERIAKYNRLLAIESEISSKT